MKAITLIFTLFILLACNNAEKKIENNKYQSATPQDRQAMAKDFCTCLQPIKLTQQTQQLINSAAMSTTPKEEIYKQLELLKNDEKLYSSTKISVEQIVVKNTQNSVTPCIEKLRSTYGDKLNENSTMFGLDMTNELLKIDCVSAASILRLWLNSK